MERTIANDSSFIPSTYNATFHGSLDSNPWIQKMPYRRLGKTDLNVSLLSYGGSSLAKFYGDEIILQEVVETVQNSIKSGINFIDTSPWYGDSETLLGQALKGVPRNAYYIATKVGRNFTPGWENRFDFTRESVLKNVENSLALLGLQYVDIIQVHDLEFCLDPELIIKETLPALESIVRAGKAKSIGITSYSLETMKKAIESSHVKIDTILSYSRMNFHDTSLLDYMPFFQERDIGVINAAPVAMGLYTSRGPPAWHPASDDVKSVTKLATDFIKGKGVSIEDAALGFSLRPQNSKIGTTLVSMPNQEILNQNLGIITKARTPDDDALYQDVIKIFQKNVKGPGHWEGRELEEYKLAMNITK